MISLVRVGPWRFLPSALLLGAVLALVGCRGKLAGTVSGKLSYKGEAVTTGSVNFYAPDKGVGALAPLDSSGAFKFSTPLPPGTYKVYVQPPPPEQLPPGSPVKKAPSLAIPPKYLDASTTTLTLEVKAGQNEFPIELAD